MFVDLVFAPLLLLLSYVAPPVERLPLSLCRLRVEHGLARAGEPLLCVPLPIVVFLALFQQLFVFARSFLSIQRRSRSAIASIFSCLLRSTTFM